MDKLSKRSLKEQYKNRTLTGGVYLIKCREGGMVWVRGTIDLKGAENRFVFSKSMDSCPENAMRELWNRYGGEAFTFEIVEDIRKKDTQSEEEFSQDVKVLFEMWQEKQKGEEINGREG
ncbi:GIY-YIG nuclease family protein [Lacrimispora algidixylanolytica]|uniref:LuxR family transcriptional regulator n=1 Tax=Lacrimispora algidixylanolytica TaxID=94868 RepID=A0A419T7C7_9FIRM|nr:GIY-YIG nuclease family protein [Lacrimispora algidixylanolytica]RKD33313.1 hypothetical protein BET01_14920 [Lacrimispora algidixylanolytica]